MLILFLFFFIHCLLIAYTPVYICIYFVFCWLRVFSLWGKKKIKIKNKRVDTKSTIAVFEEEQNCTFCFQILFLLSLSFSFCIYHQFETMLSNKIYTYNFLVCCELSFVFQISCLSWIFCEFFKPIQIESNRMPKCQKKRMGISSN